MTTKKSSGHVLIVDPTYSGHHLMYVRLIVQRARAAGLRATVYTSTGASLSSEYRQNLATLSHPPAVFEVERPTASGALAFARTNSIDRVLFLDGDRWLVQVVLATFARIRLGIAGATILLMRPRPHPGFIAQCRYVFKRFVQCVAGFRPGLTVFELSGPLTFEEHKLEVPDPVSLEATLEDVQRFRQKYQIDGSVFWFGLAGAIDARKNPTLVCQSLLEAVENRRGAVRVGILIAGRVDSALTIELEEQLQRLESAGVEVRRVNDYLSPQEFDSAIACADCLVVAHDNEGSSGIMSKGLLAGSRILASGASRILRAEVQASQGRAIWADLEVAGMATAMTSLIDAGSDRQSLPLQQTEAIFAERLLTGHRKTRPTRLDVVQILLSPRIGGAESVAAVLEAEFGRRAIASKTIYLNSGRRSPFIGRIVDLIALMKSLRSSKPRLIISHSAIPNLYARAAAPRRVPVITVLHSASDDYKGRIGQAERLLRLRTSAVVAVSNVQASRYAAQFGRRIPIRVIPNAVAWDATSQQRTPPARRIVTLARVAQQKNPELWMEAAAKVCQADASITMEWYGPSEPPYEIDTLNQLFSPHGDVSGPRFKGPTIEPEIVLGKADILFHPADREAHSMAILEAAALGIPVVAAKEVDDSSGMSIAAATFPAGDAGEASKALLRVVADYDSAAREAYNRRAGLMDVIGADRMVDDYLAVMSNVGGIEKGEAS